MRRTKERSRARRAVGVGAVGISLLVAGVVGGVGLAKAPLGGLQSGTTGTTATTGTTGTTPASRKVVICHKTASKKKPGVTIVISTNAWKAHQKHGDTLGACSVTQPSTTTSGTITSTTTTTTNDHRRGKSEDAPGRTKDKPGKK